MSFQSNKYKQKSKFTAPALDVGTYPARVVQLILLGLQEQPEWQGQSKDPKHEMYVTYELVDEFLLDEDGNDLEDKPRWLSETFTMNSLDSDLAKSTKRYLALDPEVEHGGDWSMLMGTPCMVSVVRNEGKGKHKGKVFNNISSVQSMREKEKAKTPELKNPGKLFDFDDPDLTVFLQLPEWLQDKIKGSLEFPGSVLETLLENHEPESGGEATKETKKATQKPAQEVSEDDEDDWDIE